MATVFDKNLSPYRTDSLFNDFNDLKTEQSLQNEFQARIATFATALLLFYTSGVYALGFLIAREAQSICSQLESLQNHTSFTSEDKIEMLFKTTVFCSTITDRYSKEIAEYIPNFNLSLIQKWERSKDLHTVFAAISSVSLGLLVICYSKLALFSLITHDLYASLRGFHAILRMNKNVLKDTENDVPKIVQNTILFKIIELFPNGKKWIQTNIVEQYARKYFPTALNE